MAKRARKQLSFTQIDTLSESELRKEYTVMRDIFTKRIGRLSKAYPSRAAPYQPGGWAYVPTLKEIAQKPYMKYGGAEQRTADLRFRVKELTNLLGENINEVPLSIKGIKAQKKGRQEAVVKALKEAGYEHISKSTLRNFGRFMEAMRTQYGMKNPMSEEQVEFFNSLKYKTKRYGAARIKALWEDFVKNGFQSDDTNADLFAT